MGYEYLRASGALDQNPSTGVKATEEDHALINDVFKAIRDEPEFTSVCQKRSTRPTNCLTTSSARTHPGPPALPRKRQRQISASSTPCFTRTGTPPRHRHKRALGPAAVELAGFAGSEAEMRSGG